MKKLPELTIEELTKRKSVLTGCAIGFGVLMVFAAFLLIFLNAKLVLFIPLMVVPITMLPVFISLKSLSDEMKSRNRRNSTEY